MIRQITLFLLVCCALYASALRQRGFSHFTRKLLNSRHATGHSFGTVLGDLPPNPSPETRFIEQPISHYWPNSDTYNQRYFYAADFWGKPQPNLKLHRDQQNNYDQAPIYASKCPGPILFYTGNESPIELYYNASGFFTQYLAPKLGALIIFAEHRYFGQSLPYGKDHVKHPQFLSADLAMLDYATLLDKIQQDIRKEYGMGASERCPVIAFGGSYGGMLTAWFRSKYPHIVDGALASSGPFGFVGAHSPVDKQHGQMQNVVDEYSFYDVSTQTICSSNNKCCNALTDALRQIDEFGTTSSGLMLLTKTFRLCKPLSVSSDLWNWVEDGFISMTMMDYPYPTDYGMELPGFPVNKTCDILTGRSTVWEVSRNHVESRVARHSIANRPHMVRHSDTSFDAPVLERLAGAMNIPFNYSGNAPCFDLDDDGPDWDRSELGWDYLFCSGLYFPMSSRLPPFGHGETYNIKDDYDYCYRKFNITLRPEWAVKQYSGFSFPSISNTIFSNGLLDPWSGLGLTNVTWLDKLHGEEYDINNNALHERSVHIINIAEAAHHLDLRAPCNEDPVYVRDARVREENIIYQWLKPYFL